MSEHQRLLEHLEKVEDKAGEILTDRKEIIALDKRRNDDRIGIRALQKHSHEKTWITVGPLLLKMPSKAAEELLEKGKVLKEKEIYLHSIIFIFCNNIIGISDQRECSTAINKLRSDLKIKVNELRDLELTPPVPGLMLEPMSHTEMDAMRQVLGRSV